VPLVGSMRPRSCNPTSTPSSRTYYYLFPDWFLLTNALRRLTHSQLAAASADHMHVILNAIPAVSADAPGRPRSVRCFLAITLPSQPSSPSKRHFRQPKRVSQLHDSSGQPRSGTAPGTHEAIGAETVAVCVDKLAPCPDKRGKCR
jgi:hypothetical protein